MGKHSHKVFLVLAALSLLLFGVILGSGLLSQEDDTASDVATNSQVDDSSESDAPVATEPAAPAATSLFRSSYTIAAQPNCEESGNFIDLTKFDGPGAGYPDPEYTVTCTEDELTVTSNNIPHTEFVMLTPNDLEAADKSWTIPRNPVLAAAPTQIGYEDGGSPTLGDLGFAVNGVPWYGPTEGAFPDPYGDPYTHAIIDDCGGHHNPYHYHIMVTTCFFPDWTVDQPAPIVGYALDGFPVYGPTGCSDAACSEVLQFKSSYNVTGNLETYAWDNVEFVADQGSEYLDQCNGRTQPDGSYGYHLTEGFPYIIGCFVGEFERGGAGGGQAPNGGGQQGPIPGGPNGQ